MHRRKGDLGRRIMAFLIAAGIIVLAYYAVLFSLKLRESGRIRTGGAFSEAESVLSAADTASGVTSAEAVLEEEDGKKEEKKDGGKEQKEDKKKALKDEAARTEAILSEQTIEANQENAEILKGLIAAAVPDVSGYAAAIRGDTASSSRIICIDPARQASEMTETEAIGPGLGTRAQKMLPGAVGAVSGKQEYEVTLEVCTKLKEELLRRGYNVVMTREANDVEISEAARARTANLAGADILVHVSCGASDDPATSGILAYAPTYDSPNLENRLVSASQTLADDILESLAMQTGMSNLGILDGDRVTGINWAELPVTTIQIGFLSNAEDELFVSGAGGQSRIVTGLAGGIDAYFTALGGGNEETTGQE